MALVWKSRQFFFHGCAWLAEFLAGWRREKLECSEPREAGQQFGVLIVLAECRTRVGIRSRIRGFRPKICGARFTRKRISNICESRACEYGTHALRKFRCEMALIFERSVRVELLGVRRSRFRRPPPIWRWWKILRWRFLVRRRSILNSVGLTRIRADHRKFRHTWIWPGWLRRELTRVRIWQFRWLRRLQWFRLHARSGRTFLGTRHDLLLCRNDLPAINLGTSHSVKYPRVRQIASLNATLASCPGKQHPSRAT
jgi:hypothetical protein